MHSEVLAGGHEAPQTRSFRRHLALILLAAAALRVVYCFVVMDDPLSGDAGRYSAYGVTIAAGRGFADPFADGPAAEHPPGAGLVQSVAPLILPDDWTFGDHPAFVFGQRLTMAAVGVSAVAVLGLVGRRYRDDRLGLVVAGVAAINPLLWVNDGLLMSESLATLTIALVLLAALRAWDLARTRDWALLGGVCGLAALVRSETLLLCVVMILPMIWWRSGRAWSNLWRWTGAAAIAV
ncbi:MAG: hypothetical protein GX868_04620, partial [Actinobacteria bacterium]|nr:hypothetical protein [Actinomycetota bacterium]